MTVYILVDILFTSKIRWLVYVHKNHRPTQARTHTRAHTDPVVLVLPWLLSVEPTDVGGVFHIIQPITITHDRSVAYAGLQWLGKREEM